MSNSTTDGSDDSFHFEYYRYEPSMAAAVVFIILFAISTLAHSYQMFRSRIWFMIPFLIGGFCEVIGYIGRALSSKQAPGPYTMGPYIIQSTLLLIAPALFAASIYMELGRIVLMLHGERQLFIRRTWLTKIFVGGDVLSFLTQASGAGLMASGNSDSVKTGENIVVGGLFIQIVFFGLFVVAAGIFHWRINQTPTQQSMERPFTKHMLSLYAVSLLIFVRSIVRVVEFIQGFDGYIISNEWYLYVFDGMVMFVASVIMNIIHPSEVKKFIVEDELMKRTMGRNEVSSEGYGLVSRDETRR